MLGKALFLVEQGYRLQMPQARPMPAVAPGTTFGVDDPDSTVDDPDPAGSAAFVVGLSTAWSLFCNKNAIFHE